MRRAFLWVRKIQRPSAALSTDPTERVPSPARARRHRPSTARRPWRLCAKLQRVPPINAPPPTPIFTNRRGDGLRSQKSLKPRPGSSPEARQTLRRQCRASSGVIATRRLGAAWVHSVAPAAPSACPRPLPAPAAAGTTDPGLRTPKIHARFSVFQRARFICL